MAGLLPVSEIDIIGLDVTEFVEDTSNTYKMQQDTMHIKDNCTDLDAMVQAVYCLLNTQVDEYIIYSTDRRYGWDYYSLIGMPTTYVVPEIERRIVEALLLDTRITDVNNFEFEVNKNNVHVTFDVATIYGITQVKTDVNY